MHKENNLLKCTACGYNFFVNMAPAATAMILNEQNHVLLAQRKFEPFKGMWQTPGGFMQLHESYEEAVKREMMEELGVKIELGKFLGAFPDQYPYQGVMLQFVAIVCLATIIEGNIEAKDDVSEVRFFSLEEARKTEIAYRFLEELIEQELGN